MIFGIHTKRMALTEDVDLEEFIAAKGPTSTPSTVSPLSATHRLLSTHPRVCLCLL